MKLRSQLRKNKILQILSSLKLTVYCLLLLFILTLWGTIAQVQSGLYLAQERYFHSFFFLAFGFLPFPGGQGVMWVLFFNLLSVALTRFIYEWRHIGILVIHFGLLMFLVSGFVTLEGSQESYIGLSEGEASNVSNAYHTWEISIWKDQGQSVKHISREVTALDLNALRKEAVVSFPEFEFDATVKELYKNSAAYTQTDLNRPLLNASGIKRLERMDLDKAPEKNNPGVILSIKPKNAEAFEILLYGSERKPTAFNVSGQPFNVIMRLKRYQLPFTLKLIDFMMEKHPGTDTPRAFKSQVSIDLGKASREKLISMNNPLRYKNYTFYQSSYAIDQFGRETSILAVVKNTGRLLPYISTFVTFGGLVIHFAMVAVIANKKKKVTKKSAK